MPTRNEEKYIVKCLQSILENDFPKNKIEILVVDGMSEDGTREILNQSIQKCQFIKIVDNPRKIVPSALNLGINKAKGEIIMRVDAHTTYDKKYIVKCVKYLEAYNADNVGGICITLPENNTIFARTIALVLSHPFGVGNAYFRTGSKEPRAVDTVPFGCYKKEVFDKIGLFNENLIRNQDIDFNLRLKRAGGKILLVPDIVSYYHARSTLKDLFTQNFWNGFWVIYSNKFAKIPFSLRHLVPFLFVISLIGSLTLSLIYRPFFYFFILIFISYLITNIFFSFTCSLQKSSKYFFPLILSFATLHISYGLGSLWGFIKIISFKK